MAALSELGDRAAAMAEFKRMKAMFPELVARELATSEGFARELSGRVTAAYVSVETEAGTSDA